MTKPDAWRERNNGMFDTSIDSNGIEHWTFN